MRAREYIPSLREGHKIYPEDLASLTGRPYVGDVWYVDPTNGSDTANSGTSWDDAFVTVGKAYSSAPDNSYDVIILAPGTHTASTESSAITWSKDHLTLVGNVAPVMFSHRARVLAAASVSPLITVSGYGNVFANVQLASWNDNNGLVKITGERNAFLNVHLAGIGHTDTGDDTASSSLEINSAGENYFSHCVLGVDTVLRSAANRSLYFTGTNCNRNVFEDCLFVAAIDATTPVFVEADSASAVDRFTLFNRCHFVSFSSNEGTAMASVFKIPASPQTHRYILTDCIAVDGAGTMDWDSNNRGDIFANMSSPAASAAGGIATSQ